MLSRHHGELRYDLQRLDVDIDDFWRGQLSILRLNEFLRMILKDRTSALMRALEPNASRWGETEHLLAHLLDVIRGVRYPGPDAWDRPGDVEKARSDRDIRRARWEARQAKAGGTGAV